VPDSHVRMLTTAVASGDTEAFGRFYDEWFDFMYAQARHITQRDEATCLDIVQDAMMRVIRSLKPFDNQSSLQTWLRVVVMSCAYDYLRSESRRRQREQIACSDRNSTIIPESDITEQLAWLRNELAAMGRHNADLFLFRHRMGWTLRTIGNLVGLSPGAVDGRISRTLKELRQRAVSTFQE